MSPTVEELLAAVLKLPPDEQQELAERLNDHLDPSDIDEMTEEEFEAELERRHEEFMRDPSAGVSWEEMKRQMLSE